MTRSKKRKLARQKANFEAMSARPDKAKAMRSRQKGGVYRGRREFGRYYAELAGSWSDVAK